MKTILATLFFSLLILQISFGQESKLDTLQKRKNQLENQINSLTDELKTVDSEIKAIEREEALIKLKSGASFNVKISMDGQVRNAPSIIGKVIFKVDSGTIVSAHKKERSYIYISTYEGNRGWISDLFIQNDEAYKSMIKGLTLLQEDSATYYDNIPEVHNTETDKNETKSTSNAYQAHLFKNNKERGNEGNGWGIWVKSSQSIIVVNWGGGKYEIRIYDYGNSLPVSTMKVQYSKMNGSLFEYIPYTTGHSVNYIIQSSIKLSLMAQGYDGNLNLFFPDMNIIYSYICSDF